MKKLLLKTTLLLVSGMLVFSACNNDDPPQNDFDTNSTKDNNSATTEWDDVNDIVSKAMKGVFDNQGGSMKTSVQGSITITGMCGTIYFDTAADTLLIDFGTGCTDPYGTTRSGQLHIAYTDAYHNTGAVITTTTRNYVVDGVQLDGQKQVTNVGNIGGDTIQFDVEVGDVGLTGGYATITYTNNQTASWKSTRTRLWVEGSTTNADLTQITDDVYHIYGSAQGINRDGLGYTMTVPASDPLQYSVSCWLAGNGIFPESGTLTIDPDGLAERIIDYSAGTGGCDRTVKVTISGFNIFLNL